MVEMTWNADTTHALGLYRIFGQLIGIWPLNYKSTSSKIRVIIFVISQLWLCIDLTIQLSIKGNCGTMAEIVDVMSWIAVGFSTSVKVILLTVYQQNMHIILSTAVVDWTSVIDQKSRSIMLRFANIGRIGSLMQIFSSCSVGFLQVTRCLPSIISTLNHQLNFTVPTCIPLWPSCWIQENAFDYAVNFVNQFILVVIVIVSYSGCESFFFGTAMHLTGQFEELHRNPKYLHGGGSCIQTHQFVEFVRRHKHLLMLANNFEETYNIIILIHVAIDVLIPCASGILMLISLQAADFVTVGAMTVRIFLAYLQLFVYSYVGEQLSSQAGKVRAAVYNSPWHEMSPDAVKEMIFVMMKCNHPFNLTAGKIYDMNIPNFTGIVKTITSYFSVIRLMFITDN